MRKSEAKKYHPRNLNFISFIVIKNQEESLRLDCQVAGQEGEKGIFFNARSNFNNKEYLVTQQNIRLLKCKVRLRGMSQFFEPFLFLE